MRHFTPVLYPEAVASDVHSSGPPRHEDSVGEVTAKYIAYLTNLPTIAAGLASTPDNGVVDARSNREFWDRTSDEYQAAHGSQLNKIRLAWGVWQIPEDDLRVLGDVAGKDILELGCGAAQWSIALAGRGARPVGVDNSQRQLEHARRLMAEAGVDFRLVHASADDVPLPDASFDVVFCDHGGMSFADPYRTVPEVARLLRPRGLFAFCMLSPLMFLCTVPGTEQLEDRLHIDYFGMRRFARPEGNVEYQLPYGEWIRLFRRHGFVIEDLQELQAPDDAESTYFNQHEYEWARRWPAEIIWRLRLA